MNKGLKFFFLALGGTALIVMAFLGYLYLYREETSATKDITTNTVKQSSNSTAKEKEEISNSFENKEDNISSLAREPLPEPEKSDSDQNLNPDEESSLNKNSNKFLNDNDDEEETDDGVTVEVESDDE